MPNRFSVANRASFLKPQTKRKNLARYECKMCIVHIAKQKLRAGVEKSGAHKRS